MKQHPKSLILLLIIILTAFIIGMSIFSEQLLRRDSDSLNAKIDLTVKYAEKENWKSAESSVNELGEIWSDVKGNWSALIDHMEIDNIDVTLSQLQTLVKAKELPDTLSESAALKTYIGHIPEKEKLKLENLF